MIWQLIRSSSTPALFVCNVQKDPNIQKTIIWKDILVKCMRGFSPQQFAKCAKKVLIVKMKPELIFKDIMYRAAIGKCFHALKKSVQNRRTMTRMASGIEGLMSHDNLAKIVKFLKLHRAQHPHFKIGACAIVVWASSPAENFTALKQIPVRTFSKLGTDLKSVAIGLIVELADRIQNFEHNGSGYILHEIMALDL